MAGREQPQATRSNIDGRGGLRSAALIVAGAVAMSWACSQATVRREQDAEVDRKRLQAEREMALQRAYLEELLGDREDLAAPPPGVDEAAWQAAIPDDNPITLKRIALGRDLFFEPALSRDGTVACASCHDARLGFTDGRKVSVGIGGAEGRRNTPSVLNAAFQKTLFWDGRAPTLEEQAAMPILNRLEMGQPSRRAIVDSIADKPEYRRAFREAYDAEPNISDLLAAIASFERTLVFIDGPFDRFLAGDSGALTEAERKGFELFNGKALCSVCHMLQPEERLGTDHLYHNLGTPALDSHAEFDLLARKTLNALRLIASAQELDGLVWETDAERLGRFLVTHEPEDIGAFRTPGLRNVGITAPYMHEGSMETLWDVVDFYDRGCEPSQYLDEAILPLHLTEEEIDQLVAFLFALTDDRFADLNRREFERQKKLAAARRPWRAGGLVRR